MFFVRGGGHLLTPQEVVNQRSGNGLGVPVDPGEVVSVPSVSLCLVPLVDECVEGVVGGGAVPVQVWGGRVVRPGCGGGSEEGCGGGRQSLDFVTQT